MSAARILEAAKVLRERADLRAAAASGRGVLVKRHSPADEIPPSLSRTLADLLEAVVDENPDEPVRDVTTYWNPFGTPVFTWAPALAIADSLLGGGLDV